MYIIGFSGTNRTGKSSTIKRLLPYKEFRNAVIIRLSELVALCPYQMNENQTIEGSAWMADQVNEIMEKITPNGIYIFDRSPLDILAFTLYAQKKLATSAPHWLVEKTIVMTKKFNHIYYFPIRKGWPYDNNIYDHSIIIDSLMKECINKYDLVVTYMPEQMKQRLLLVLSDRQ